MRNRMTLAASAVVMLVTAASSFSVQPGNAQTTKAKADECQSRPGTSTPSGSHWYYRIERGSGRRCWYLGAKNKSTAAAATERAAPAERAERAAPERRTAAAPPPPRSARVRADEEAEIPASARSARAMETNAARAYAAPDTTNQSAADWPAYPNAAPAPTAREATTTVPDNTRAESTRA
jgi:hypothetical protein